MQYYREDIDSCFKELNTSIHGLEQVDANHRLKEHGLNQLISTSKINIYKIFLNQFKSFIIYILLFAVILSFALQHYVDAVLVLVILIANALIGFFQELSAQKSLEALKNLSKQRQTNVYRGKQLIKVDIKDLVPGDVIFLEAGDNVPADCRIIEARNLKVKESQLTGESLPVSKRSEKMDKLLQISDQKNMLFSSTLIEEGSAKALVVRTGMLTEIGKIFKMVEKSDEEEKLTPLQQRLETFGQKLGGVIIVICLLTFAILLFTKGFSSDNLIIFGLVAVSLAVAAVPTALPAVVTIALSIGVKRLLKRKALVLKLSSVETLGSCDVICTDKTGTLTKNEMTVTDTWVFGKAAKIEGAGYNPQGHVSLKLDSLLYKIGLYCNNASLFKKEGMWKISGDPTEAALIVSAKKSGLEEGKIPRLNELPFDSSRKMMSVLVKEDKIMKQFTKGSPQQLIQKCSKILIDGREVKLTLQHKDEILAQVNSYSRRALRVLAFAYKRCRSENDFKENDLVFVGLQAMIDPPREDVFEAIKKTKKAGIRVIMITGDYKETARAIGDAIGITGKVMSGDEIEQLSDRELEDALLDKTNIFARVVPEHKQRIIAALQNQGHIVAMTGDGVNDAPALSKANIGVSVGSGTDAAREASDFVLLDDSFATIVSAIEEGRGIYDNIQKSIMLLLSGNLGEVLIIFLAVLLGWNLPLTAVLLLWINLVTDGAPALAFSVDPYGQRIMERMPKSPKEGILPKDKLTFIGVFGVMGTIIGLYLFRYFGGSSDVGTSEFLIAQTIIFNFIVFYEIVLIFLIRSEYNVSQFTNSWLWGAIVFSLLLQALLMYTPLGSLFGLAALGVEALLILIVSAFILYLTSYPVQFIVKKINYS